MYNSYTPPSPTPAEAHLPVVTVTAESEGAHMLEAEGVNFVVIFFPRATVQ
jgi:hypothetical protein